MTASSTRQLPSAAGGVPQGDHLGVRGRVPSDLPLVVAGADDLALADHDGPDRDVFVLGRAGGLSEGQAHEVLISGKEV